MSGFSGSGATYPGSPPPAGYDTRMPSSVISRGRAAAPVSGGVANAAAFQLNGVHSVLLSCCAPHT